MSGNGSVGIIGAARCGLLAAFDPEAIDDQHRHVLAISKLNLAATVSTLKYQTVSTTIRAEGGDIETVRVAWLGESSFRGDAIVARESTRIEKRDVVREVTEELRQVLKDGPRPAQEVYERVGRGKDDWALKKARAVLNIRVAKERGKGRQAPWTWTLDAPTLEEEVS